LPLPHHNSHFKTFRLSSGLMRSDRAIFSGPSFLLILFAAEGDKSGIRIFGSSLPTIQSRHKPSR
jgi:hypothetical protein